MGFEQLHARGRETFAESIPGGQERLDEIFRVAPALAEVAVGTVYGHLHHRPALDPRTREAVTLAAIVASGMHGTPLAVHVRTGLAAGLAPAEIVEVVVQAAAFSGFPRAVASLPVIEEVFQHAALPVPPTSSPREVVLAAIDELRHTEGTTDDAEAAPTAPWAECLLLGTRIAVYTIAPDQALVVAHRGARCPEAVAHVLVEENRIAEITWLAPATRADTNHPDSSGRTTQNASEPP